MTKKFSAKKIALVAVLACICAAVAIVLAYAYYYAHNEEHVEASNQGVMEVVCTLDETAVGGGIHTGIVFVAEGATAKDAIAEAVISPLAANEPSAIKDHSAQATSEYLTGKTYTVNVYDAASQKPGTQTTNDVASKGGESTTLNRYDRVVITVS